MDNSFSRESILIGKTEFKRLQSSHVMVIGLGGVGSWAAEAIGRMGVGHISLVDGDKVESSNINRQLGALNSTVGLDKTAVWAARLKDINPTVIIDQYAYRFNAASEERLLRDAPDAVVDAIDALTDKALLIRSCQARGIWSIHSMGAANRLDPSQIRRAKLSETSVCPLARRLRRELSDDALKANVETVFSTEPPRDIRIEGSTALGTVSYVPSVFGLFLAAGVINHLIGA
ncbi:MAG: tRNA threonylcarbamoyladenosine dehydratase [Syntrophomonadaceae bacterium]|nr:tRNA threonylcarbamoyladenosine dehydratase [Syntrophomonadaceae bacterium]